MIRTCLIALVAVAVTASLAVADPCGMVPPITIEGDIPINRIGLQKTYVFYKGGVETFVIRPGFEGKSEEFGMLIPFPNPPAIRKVPDAIFGHIESAIDPPEVVIDLTPVPQPASAPGAGGGGPPKSAPPTDAPLAIDVVNVINEEAVGMYQVVVLEAGSAAALKKWMDDNGYKYPEGMDKVCDEYVKIRWCFVAVKTRVAGKSSVAPRPGVREVNGKLPTGATFDGHVQAMGFRFHSEEIVVPMRLSAFNAGELRNVVYLMTDGPRRIRSIPEEYVVRQLTGKELHRNVTGPRPLRIIGGTAADLPEYYRKSLAQRRDPAPHNGHARDLFASDLLAVSKERLSHPHEEAEKMLLRVGEHFGLRGEAIDRLNGEALADDRRKAVAEAVDDIQETSLTVLDGDFPRDVLARQNLTFAEYRMPARRNTPAMYDTRLHSPGDHPSQGIRYTGPLKLSHHAPRRPLSRWIGSIGSIDSRARAVGFAALLAMTLIGIVIRARRAD